MKTNPLILICLCILILTSACNRPANSTASGTTNALLTKGQSAVEDDESANSVLRIAIQSEAHSTLVAAVQAAGLEDVLVNAGPLTVFAPTNDAFAQLPDGTVDELLLPENKEKLATIIKFHAAPGKYVDKLFKDGMNLFMATGHYVKVEKEGETIRVGGANILGTVEASNGVVHVVDKVLLPPAE